MASESLGNDDFERNRIQPYPPNPYYWQYKGKPILLIGGTHDDNPFNAPANDPIGNRETIENHLDLFASSGGNYVRNTMSHRDILNVYPYLREPDLFYDPLNDPKSWISTNGNHASNTEIYIDNPGSLTLWGSNKAENPISLVRELPETDFIDGTIEMWFWARDAITASKIDRLELRLASAEGSATAIWPGQIMAGWHLLIFHIDEFEAEGFESSGVNTIELRVKIKHLKGLERFEYLLRLLYRRIIDMRELLGMFWKGDLVLHENDIVWDNLAVRGKFNLQHFNPEYWQRFRNFLDMSLKRELIVQIELWDKVDLFNDGSGRSVKWHPRQGWSKHPFNPRNNVNYTAESSGLKTEIDWSYHPRGNFMGDADTNNIHPFWFTVPGVAELLPGKSREIHDIDLDSSLHARLVEMVLPYQQAFVNQILDIALSYPNVIYTINNETFLPSSDWSDYWANYVHEYARTSNRSVEVGDMRGENQLHDAPQHAHLHIIENPQLYSFIDISQNNDAKPGIRHWQELQWVRKMMSGTSNGIRPINNVKIYDSVPRGKKITRLDASVQKFWRNIFGGAASSRFHRRMGAALHRPYDGDGSLVTSESNKAGLNNFRSAMMLVEAMNIFAAKPANHILNYRKSTEVYAIADVGQEYAVYFPASGSVKIEVIPGLYEIQYLDIMESMWLKPSHIKSNGTIPLSSFRSSHSVIVLKRIEEQAINETEQF